MRTAEYWQNAALLREIAVQEGATLTAKDILRLYDEALDDINKEIKAIKANYQKRYGLDENEAAYFLSQAQQDENLKNLIYALEQAPNEKARRDILEYIQSDGLSVRAYAARTERYRAVENVIYSRMKRLAAAEITSLSGMLKKAYKESYYGVMDDTAKGLDVGINFAILNDNAIDEAVGAKWHGKRLSERVWNNTDRLAAEAQELVVKSLMSGESLTKTSKKLVEVFQVEKYHATTLIHTETAHIHAMADMKAYEDLGIEEYKYLATLDYRTCETCQPLDNKVFKVSEAREGENYPVMHPRCRCTTTINMDYTNRRARNPLTGKNEIVDGSMNYQTWLDSLTPEQKAARETSIKKDDNKTADKLQYAKYKNVLGSENMPKTFDLFQDMKYNDIKQWGLLKDYKQSRSSNMISAFTSFDDYKKYKQKIEDELIGLTTVDGVEIKSQSKHFIERVFGTSKDPRTGRPRDGVEIEDIKDALINGQSRKKADSTKYRTDSCEVAVNPNTGVLIQTNPQ